MSVKWIGDVARELNIDVFEAIELLASKQNYPMNGLLDEDRVQMLKRDVNVKHGVEASGIVPRPAPPAIPAVPGASGAKAALASAPSTVGRPDAPAPPRAEVTSVTSPIPQMRDSAEDRTVILPPPE
ncbi:MAG: hypothetical protein ABIT01_11790 [Thermoanaerobaculia bacterium]